MKNKIKKKKLLILVNFVNFDESSINHFNLQFICLQIFWVTVFAFVSCFHTKEPMLICKKKKNTLNVAAIETFTAVLFFNRKLISFESESKSTKCYFVNQCQPLFDCYSYCGSLCLSQCNILSEFQRTCRRRNFYDVSFELRNQSSFYFTLLYFRCHMMTWAHTHESVFISSFHNSGEKRIGFSWSGWNHRCGSCLVEIRNNFETGQRMWNEMFKS